LSVVFISAAAGVILALAPFAAIDNTGGTWRWAPEGDWLDWGVGNVDDVS
jgi:hypothetical protein